MNIDRRMINQQCTAIFVLFALVHMIFCNGFENDESSNLKVKVELYYMPQVRFSTTKRGKNQSARVEHKHHHRKLLLLLFSHPFSFPKNNMSNRSVRAVDS